MELDIVSDQYWKNKWNDEINGEVNWLAGVSGYKSEELERMNSGDYDEKLIYYANKSIKESKAMDEVRNKMR